MSCGPARARLFRVHLLHLVASLDITGWSRVGPSPGGGFGVVLGHPRASLLFSPLLAAPSTPSPDVVGVAVYPRPCAVSSGNMSAGSCEG